MPSVSSICHPPGLLRSIQLALCMEWRIDSDLHHQTFRHTFTAPKEVISGKVGRASQRPLLHLIVYSILPSLVKSPLSILILFHVQQKNTESLTQKEPLHQHNITPNAHCKRFVIGMSKTE